MVYKDRPGMVGRNVIAGGCWGEFVETVGE